VDGIECAGEIILGPNREATISGRRTSGSTVSPFKFSPLNLTGTVFLTIKEIRQGNSLDDDEFLESAGHKDVGLIRVEIWTINMAGTKPYSNIAPVEESKIHERSKKGGTHQIKPVFNLDLQPRRA
jgi:hypothetical protein